MKTAIIVIDMQNDFVTPGGSLFINDSLITLKVAKHIDTYYEQYERGHLFLSPRQLM